MPQKCFVTHLQHFELSQFSTDAHIKKLMIGQTCETNPSHSFQHILLIIVICRNVPAILKICMKEMSAENMTLNKCTGFVVVVLCVNRYRRIHYAIMSEQYTAIFHGCKIVIFR